MYPFLFLFFLLSIYPLAASAQQAETTSGYVTDKECSHLINYIHHAMNFNKVMPQEKVYLHFDNTGYFENETMWFKAYVVRADSQEPTDLSKVLYVELVNPSGDIVKTKKYPIDENGQAHGDMKLDTLCGSGFYEVRAYTRYMTNWGVNAVFSRVFPIYKAPQEEGDYSHLTIRTMLRQHRDPNNRSLQDSLYLKARNEGIYTNSFAQTISVSFYPEGGNLVVGKKCRVAMLAADDDGKPYQGKGFVLNDEGSVLALVETDSLGRGLWEIVPDGTHLTLHMENKKGKVQSFHLPDAKKDGCALTFDAVSENIIATLQCSRQLHGQLLGCVVMHNGNITYCDTIIAQPLIEIELDRTKQHEGVNQFTVFNHEGRILAERLFFIIPHAQANDTIHITTATQHLHPCGKVELNLSTRPHATLSLAAIDAGTMTNGSQGDIKTWMLLSSEVKGYIHNVDYYFEADDKEHRASADLLMLTQGWRRYDWKVMMGLDTLAKREPIEDKFYVHGRLGAYRKRNPVSNVRLDIYLYNKSGQSLSGTTMTDKDGYYTFEMPFANGEWQMQLFTRRKNKKGDEKRKTYYVSIDRQFSPKPRYITPLERLIAPPKQHHFLGLKEKASMAEEETITLSKNVKMLKNVTVAERRRYFTNDDWTYKNENYGRQYATIFYDADKERDDALDRGEPIPYLWDFLSRRNSLFEYDEKKWTTRPTYSGRHIDWIIDNGERRIIPSVDKLWLDEVKSIYIAPHSPLSTDGSVRIYLYLHHRFSTASQKGLRRTYFQGFNIPSTFQMEDYSVLPPTEDLRRTLYWNPTVKSDSLGHATVEFYNNSSCTEMYISAEGLTPDGHFIVNEKE